jgi:hypothetical protein
MENVNDRQLSFGQRYWFILCIIVAILSPLVVHWVQVGTHHVSYEQSIDGGPKDTSYKVAAPPSTDSSKKGGGGAADTSGGGTGSQKPQ